SVAESGAPGHDRCVGRCLADLVWSGPGLSEGGAEAIVHDVVVGIDEVDVASLVDADVDELVSVAYCRVGIDVDWIVGEALSTVDRDCYPDSVGATIEARDLAGISDAAEGLVDQVIVGVEGKVSDLVLVCRMPWMVGIERVRNLGECCAAVVAARYEEIVGCGIGMVGDADLVGSVCRDPFSIVHWNGCSSGVEGERGASVVAGADVYVCEWRGGGEAGNIDVVVAIRVQRWCNCNVGVSSCWREANAPA